VLVSLFLVKVNLPSAVPCQMHIAFAGQRESETTAVKHSFNLSPETFPLSHSENFSSTVPSFSLSPFFEQEFTKAIDVNANIIKISFIKPVLMSDHSK
jgi:hypothetical protein